LPGMVSTYTPEWTWALGAPYQVPLGSAGSTTPRLDASYQSAVYTNAVNGPTNLIDGYTVANARLTWKNELEDLELGVEVTNLFDKYYFQTLTSEELRVGKEYIQRSRGHRQKSN